MELETINLILYNPPVNTSFHQHIYQHYLPNNGVKRKGTNKQKTLSCPRKLTKRPIRYKRYYSEVTKVRVSHCFAYTSSSSREENAEHQGRHI